MGSKRILLNTISVYIKIILNAVITLISTRIVLECLGVNDFGLYNLIAGVIVLLSFLNGALMVSTQRYLSIAIGEGDNKKLSSYFSASITIHFILAVLLVVVLFALEPLLINKMLNIPSESLHAAHTVYNIMILSSALTLLQVPYSAAMNAHEDIYVWAITEALNCFLKLISAIMLFYISSNKLELYTLFVFLALVISFGLKFIWCRRKYAETKLSISEMKNTSLVKEMFGFVGWNTLGSSAVLVRNQGVAILLNVFFGTAINAAYGVANQVNGLILTLASTISMVFFPSIIQAHGAGDDKKMMKLAILSSKLTFLISSVTALPLLLLMPDILNLWLKEVPAYSVEFCRLILVVFIIMQLTTGLNRVIYAIGRIKWYQIVLTVILFAIIPIGYFAFKHGMQAETVFYIMIVAQILTLLTNVYFARKYTMYDVREFCIRSILLSVVLYGIVLFVLAQVLKFVECGIVISLLYSLCACFVYIALYIVMVMDGVEKEQILKLLKLRK